MTEDEIYRTSTQYRLWSFTQASLLSLRSATNGLATEDVKAAIRSLHCSKASTLSTQMDDNISDANSKVDPSSGVDCLTVEEEQKLIGFYCTRALKFGKFCDFPTNVQVDELDQTQGYRMSLTVSSRRQLFSISNASISTIPP